MYVRLYETVHTFHVARDRAVIVVQKKRVSQQMPRKNNSRACERTIIFNFAFQHRLFMSQTHPRPFKSVYLFTRARRIVRRLLCDKIALNVNFARTNAEAAGNANISLAVLS